MLGVMTPVLVIVTMRGMLLHAFTRVYFSDEPANAVDKVLNAVPEDRLRAGIEVLRGAAEEERLP